MWKLGEGFLVCGRFLASCRWVSIVVRRHCCVSARSSGRHLRAGSFVSGGISSPPQRVSPWDGEWTDRLPAGWHLDFTALRRRRVEVDTSVWVCGGDRALSAGFRKSLFAPCNGVFLSIDHRLGAACEAITASVPVSVSGGRRLLELVWGLGLLLRLFGPIALSTSRHKHTGTSNFLSVLTRHFDLFFGTSSTLSAPFV